VAATTPPCKGGIGRQFRVSPLATVGLRCPHLTVVTRAVWHVCATTGRPRPGHLAGRILIDVDEPEQGWRPGRPHPRRPSRRPDGSLPRRERQGRVAVSRGGCGGRLLGRVVSHRCYFHDQELHRSSYSPKPRESAQGLARAHTRRLRCVRKCTPATGLVHRRRGPAAAGSDHQA
jgi:hypothetical protein